MQKHERPNPNTDPFRPPAIPVEVCCLHCGHEYESYLIEWRQGQADGDIQGFWCCPTEGCDGRGFGFDIFPTDPDYRDEHGHPMWVDTGHRDHDHDEDFDDLDELDELHELELFSQDEDEVITDWGDPAIANPFAVNHQHRDDIDPPQGFENPIIRPIRLDKDGNPIDDGYRPGPGQTDVDADDLPF